MQGLNVGIQAVWSSSGDLTIKPPGYIRVPWEDANTILIVFLFMSLFVYFILFSCEFFCVCFPNK